MSTITNKNHRMLKGVMTVGDLIAELSMYADDALVFCTTDYGDICHTEQALPVGTVEELDWESQVLAESAYSHSRLAVEDRDEDDSYDEDRPRSSKRRSKAEADGVGKDTPDVVLLRC